MLASLRNTASRSSLVLAVLAFAAVASTAGLTAYFGQQARWVRDSQPVTAVRPSEALPPGPVLEAMALGHNEALADLIWLHALSRFGQHAWRRNEPTWLDASIEALEVVDPRFELVYEWAGTVLVYGGGFTRDSIMKANEVLLRGTRRFPMAWSLWQMLGINYIVELPPTSTDPAEIEAWRELGVGYLARAGSLPNAPPTLRMAALSMYLRRAGWPELLASAASNYLRADSATDVVTARAYLARVLSEPYQLQPAAQRELRLHLSRHPRFRLFSESAAYALHPDVLYLYEPSMLLPPPFEHTR